MMSNEIVSKLQELELFWFLGTKDKDYDLDMQN